MYGICRPSLHLRNAHNDITNLYNYSFMGLASLKEALLGTSLKKQIEPDSTPADKGFVTELSY
jgi:hypothetical protein